MSIYRTLGAAATLLVCAATSGRAQAEPPTPLPAGVTSAMVSQGGSIFKGPGMCTVCHGIDGKGGVGANLTDGTWLHSKGSYEEIVQQVTTGVLAEGVHQRRPDAAEGGQRASLRTR